MSHFSPISSFPSMRPVPEALPSEPVHREIGATATDSLEPMHESSREEWKPERPVLTPPDALPHPSPRGRASSAYRFIAVTEESRNLGNKILDTLGLRLETLKQKISEISATHIQKLKESAKRAAESGFWSVLKKIATCLLSAISIVFGVSLVAS